MKRAPLRHNPETVITQILLIDIEALDLHLVRPERMFSELSDARKTRRAWRGVDTPALGVGTLRSYLVNITLKHSCTPTGLIRIP